MCDFFLDVERKGRTRKTLTLSSDCLHGVISQDFQPLKTLKFYECEVSTSKVVLVVAHVYERIDHSCTICVLTTWKYVNRDRCPHKRKGTFARDNWNRDNQNN